jgi:hypothetical protein
MAQTLSEALVEFQAVALEGEARTNKSLQAAYDRINRVTALRTERLITARNVLSEAQKGFAEASLQLADAISQVEVCEAEATAEIESLLADIMSVKLTNTPKAERERTFYAGDISHIINSKNTLLRAPTTARVKPRFEFTDTENEKWHGEERMGD